MKKRSTSIIFVITALLGFGLVLVPVSAFGNPRYARLFSFINTWNQRYYATDADLPIKTTGWKLEKGSVCIVSQDAAPGLKPVFQFNKTDHFGARYFYSFETDKEVIGIGPAGEWNKQGPAFYVSQQQLPGMIRLYRLFVPAKIKWSGLLDSIAQVTAPEQVFLTTDVAARDQAKAAGWHSDPLGYVWTKAPAVSLPDLRVEKTTINGDSLVAVIRNSSAQAGSPEVWVRLRILDESGSQVAYEDKKLSGMFQGMNGTVNFSLAGKDLKRKSYQLVVDKPNSAKESDESNNESAITPFPALRIRPDPSKGLSGKITAPTFTMAGTQPAGQKTLYQLSVTNWQTYKPEWFETATQLPPNPCGPGSSNARLQIRIQVIRTGMPLNAGCKPLNKPQDMQAISFTSASPLKESDQIRLTLIDRATNAKYESGLYSVSWFGVGNVLGPIGCKSFLGRAGSFLCTTDQGFDACQKMASEGKLIKCVRAGKQSSLRLRLDLVDQLLRLSPAD